MLETTPLVKSPGDERTRDCELQSLFDQEESPLLRYAFSLVGRRAVAEEIVQEVFLQLHRRWDEVDTPAAWLFRAVRNRAFNHLRDNSREMLHGDGAVDPASTHDTRTNEESPDIHMQRMENVAALRTLLIQLNETDRQIVKLKYFENLPYREISARTGLSIGNVGYRLHHILKELANKLRQLGIDGQL